MPPSAASGWGGVAAGANDIIREPGQPPPTPWWWPACSPVAAGGAGAGTGLAGFFDIWLITVSMVIFLWGLGTVMPNAMAGAIGPFPRMAGAASAQTPP